MITLRHLWTGWRRGLSGTTLAARYGGIDLTSLSGVTGTSVTDRTAITTSSTQTGLPAPTTGTVYSMTMSQAGGATASTVQVRRVDTNNWVSIELTWATGAWVLRHRVSGTTTSLLSGSIAAGLSSVNLTFRDDGNQIALHLNGTAIGPVSTTAANTGTSMTFSHSGSGSSSWTGIYRTVLASVGGISLCPDLAFLSAAGTGLTLTGSHAWVMRRRQAQVSMTNRGSVNLLTASNYAVGITDTMGTIKPYFQTASSQSYTPPSNTISPGTTPYLICVGTTGSETQLAMLTSSAVPTIYSAARTLGTPGGTIAITGTSGYDELLELALLDAPPTAAEIKTLYDTADWSTFAPAAGTNRPRRRTQIGLGL